MALYSKFGGAQWATAADLVMPYGPLHGINPYNKICIDFYAMGLSAGFGYGLWTIAQGLVSALGHGTAFGFVICTGIKNK
jgi:hypothetical protein